MEKYLQNLFLFNLLIYEINTFFIIFIKTLLKEHCLNLIMNKNTGLKSQFHKYEKKLENGPKTLSHKNSLPKYMMLSPRLLNNE